MSRKEPFLLTLPWLIALGVFLVSLLVVERPAALTFFKMAAAAASKSKVPTAKKAKPLDPKLKAWQGVWVLSKILEPADWEKPKGPMVERRLSSIKSYLAFWKDKVCQSTAVLGSELICHEGYGPFDGKTVRTRDGNVGGDVTLKNGQIQMTNLPEKGGGATIVVYTKTKLKAEPPDVELSLKEVERRAPIFKKGAQAILANFKSWSAKMEQEAPTFGYNFSPALLKQTSWEGPEGVYVDLYKWMERARKELNAKNYRGAHHFAVMAQETFLLFVNEAPYWRATYEDTQRQKALQQQRQLEQQKQQAEEEIADTEPVSLEAQKIQGAWQVKQYFVNISGSGQWKEESVEKLANGSNYYLVFSGNKLCLNGFVRDTAKPSSSVECRGRYYFYDFNSEDVFSDALEVGGRSQLTLDSDKFEYIKDDQSKMIFTKTSRPVQN